MAWGKIYSATVPSGDVTELTTGVHTPNKFIFSMNHIIGNPAYNANASIRVGKTTIDTGNNYSWRMTQDDAGDVTAINQDSIASGWDGVTQINIIYGINPESGEKLFISFTNQSATGVNAPHTKRTVGKWANTSAQFDIYQVKALPSGRSFTTDTNMFLLGSELTPAGAVSLTIQDGAVFEETDTNKHYLLGDGTWTEI